MLKLHYAPQSRASGILWLLEELGEHYEISLVDIRGQGGAPEAYRAIQPNKKVPAVEHERTVVTERAAICLYLCERFPGARLAPERLSPARAAYLTWLVYCDSVLDPVLAARALGWAYEGSNVSFGTFDEMVANLERTLASRAFIAGEEFTAADTQLASGIYWAMDLMKVLPEKKPFRDYLNRVCARPAFARYMEVEQKYTEGASKSAGG